VSATSFFGSPVGSYALALTDEASRVTIPGVTTFAWSPRVSS
jgi:hypothetical protein